MCLRDFLGLTFLELLKCSQLLEDRPLLKFWYQLQTPSLQTQNMSLGQVTPLQSVGF